jgi:hypothetical protein
LVAVVAVLIGVAFTLPRAGEDPLAMFIKVRAKAQANVSAAEVYTNAAAAAAGGGTSAPLLSAAVVQPAVVTVVSYNIRIDALEANPDNHYTKRVGRLAGEPSPAKTTVTRFYGLGFYGLGFGRVSSSTSTR